MGCICVKVSRYFTALFFGGLFGDKFIEHVKRERMSDIQSFITSVSEAARKQDGATLSKIIALPLKKNPVPKMYMQLAQRASSLNALAYCESNIRGDPTMSVLVGNMLLALGAFCAGKWQEAYDFEVLVYDAALAHFKESETNWPTPVLITVSNDLRVLASIVSIQEDITCRSIRRDNFLLVCIRPG